jgi:two-component system, NarL family, sensor histidine kinase UhpB
MGLSGFRAEAVSSGDPVAALESRDVAPVPPQNEPFFGLLDRGVGRLFHAALEAMVMVDEQQRIVALNQAAEQMLRYRPAELLGEPLARLVPAVHREAHAAQVGEFLVSQQLQHRLRHRREIVALRADGSEIPIEITLSRVDLMVGNQVRRYVTALMLDLSGENQMKAELERSERRVRSVFESAPVPIWIAEDHRIVFANRAAERLFAADQPLVGESVYRLLHGESHAAVRLQVARAIAGDPELVAVHGQIVRPDGALRDVEITVSALPDHGDTMVQMVVADVTVRRRETSELEQSRELLRQLSTKLVEAREEERRRIARELHDELGQRLTALKMELSGWVVASSPAGPEQRVDEMLTMLDETLASVRRISADLRPLMLDDLGLNAAIEWLARDAGRRMGVEVTLHLDESEPEVDDRLATAIFRMIQEALTNVARHARATEVRIALRRSDTELVLTVEDDGIGYPERSMQRAGSLGLLGLRERAGMFGGRLELGSPPGGGARLTIRLPYDAPPGAERAEASAGAAR